MSAVKKIKIERDRFTDDGVRLFNPTKPHGVVYADGFIEVKFIQEYEGREVHYKGDHAPVGYKHGVPLPKHADELLEENVILQNRIKDLEDSQKRTNELLERLMAQLEKKAETPAPTPPDPEPPEVYSGPTSAQLHPPGKDPARGAQKPK
jgi:hypothetical protein